MLQTVIPTLCGGFLKTLEIFAVTLLGALPLGLIIAFGSMSRFIPLKALIRTIVWIVRHAAYAPAFNNILRPRNFV